MKKLNLFDYIVILTVVAIIAVIGIKIASNGPMPLTTQSTKSYQSALVSIRVESIRKVSTESFHIGDTVLSTETNGIVGTIEKLEVLPFMDKIEKLDGKVVLAEVPERYVLIITVKSSLLERETGYFAEGITEIKANSDFRIYTKHVATTGKVKEIIFE